VKRLTYAALAALAAAALGCGGGPGGKTGTGPASTVSVSLATRRPRTTTWSVNYWQWAPTYGDYVTGTDALVAAVKPALMRVGGYNNDANTPDPFDDAALDAAVAYAQAIGAQPIIQVPLLADAAGNPPTPDTAAAIVRYANVTKGYAVPYFSIGNEPDLYDSSGLPADSSMPAKPNYTPADYCNTARAYVTAMKAVDPTIQIVGPDLAYKYQIGNGSNDWLTPVLGTCGDLFDVVSIHRYPFEAAQATLAAAEADAAAFRAVIASVKQAMASTLHTEKPLALTEMNVAYDATTCVLGASPGTVGGAMWLADALGSAFEVDLWTSAVWNVSDTENWQLGLIGPPPAHEPRPAYWTYWLYATYFGPTQLGVTSIPDGVSAYAARNAADDATELMVVNWNGAAQTLRFQITDAPGAPPPAATFVVPATSLAEIEIPDHGAAAALGYGEAQRQRGVGPEPLAAGASAPGADAGADASGSVAADGGAGRAVGAGCAPDGSICTQVTPSGPAITTMGTMSGASLSFGPSSGKWGSYNYAATGQTAPTGTVTADGDGLAVSGGFVAPVAASGNYAGFGLYFSSASCLDASAYTGIAFDFAGDLGDCRLGFGASFSGDLSHMDDATRGGCAATSATCYGPSADVTAAARAATAAAPTIKVPFASLAGGMPIATLDPTTIVTIQWQLSADLAAADGGVGACAAAFTVSNVSFY
jgi:hypothetical protein